jgi:hypothetical protein
VEDLAIATEELVQAGLCDESEQHHLTAKGRDWLQALEQMQSAGESDFNDASADLVLSTSGIFR